MKRWGRYAIIAVVLGYVGVVLAQTNNNYTCVSTTISSSSSPVAIFSPPVRITTWIAHARSSPAADPVLIWPYVGTVPTAVPSPAAVLEVPSGSSVTDQVTCPQATCMDAIGENWAAVLASGSTATTIDMCWR
jgi:hypothetical protein